MALRRLLGRSTPPEPIPLAELRERFGAMERDDLYALRRAWTARYLPIWYAVHGEIADAAGWEEAKRAKHRDAMDHALQRADDWWAGGKRVKARQNENESAVSAVTHFGPLVCGDAPWVGQARLAALQLRYFMAFIYDPASEFCVVQSATAVYGWAELETWWPGDTASMYGALPAEIHREHGQDANPFVYTVGARSAGLRKEGAAVISAVHEIVERLGEYPGPFDAEGFLQRGAGSTLRRAQRAAAYTEFHGRKPPPFVR